MRYIKYLLLTFVLLITSANTVSAADKCEPRVYMFGFAFSFNDSLLYITSVHEVQNVWLKPRNNFLIERETYTRQLEDYFKKDGITDMTCGLSYDIDRKKVMKRLQKIKARYAKKFKGIRIIEIPATSFVFNSIVPMQIDTQSDKQKRAERKKAQREQKKAARAKKK